MTPLVWKKTKRTPSEYVATCRCGHHFYRILGGWFTITKAMRLGYKVRESFCYTAWVSLNREAWVEMFTHQRLRDAQAEVSEHCHCQPAVKS